MRSKKTFFFVLLSTAIFLAIAVIHCYIFRSRLFPNRNYLFFPLIISYNIVLLAIALTLLQKLNTVRKIITASFLSPYVLSGIYGLGICIYFSFKSDGLVDLLEIIRFILFIIYIGFGGFIGTIPFLITCFLYRRSVVQRQAE